MITNASLKSRIMLPAHLLVLDAGLVVVGRSGIDHRSAFDHEAGLVEAVHLQHDGVPDFRNLIVSAAVSRIGGIGRLVLVGQGKDRFHQFFQPIQLLLNALAVSKRLVQGDVGHS